MHKMLVGVRAYLVKDNLDEHVRQLSAIRKAFPSAHVLYMACGLPVPAGAVPHADRIEHYSELPQGVGQPTERILQYAQEHALSPVVIMDGDLQHRPDQIAAIAAMKTTADLVMARRKKRVLFSREKLDGKTVEDVQNAFLRLNFPEAPEDITPGAYVVIHPEKFSGIRLSESSWIGDYVLAEHALKNNLAVATVDVDVHTNVYTLSNRKLLFREIAELEKRFGRPLQEVVARVRKNPYAFLHGGNLAALDDVMDEYRRHRFTQSIGEVKALVLAGGKGTRLKPFTETIQKQVFPIANKPILHFIMEKITSAGITEVGVIVGPNKDQVKKTLGDGSAWNARITYIEQDAPSGLAHAVLCAKWFLKDSPFLMYLGDNLIAEDLTHFLLDFVETKTSSILLVPVKDPSKFGIAEVDRNGKIVRLREKPKKTDSNLGIIGVYAFTPKIFDAIARITPSARGELEITDAIQKLMDLGEPLDYRVIRGWWIDTGTLDSLLEANFMVLDQMQHPRRDAFACDEESVIQGRVEIGKGCHISQSTIVGPVSLAPGTRVTRSFIGPYTALGPNSRVLDSRVQNTLTLEQAYINEANVMFSIIGRNANVQGQGATDFQRVIAADNEHVKP